MRTVLKIGLLLLSIGMISSEGFSQKPSKRIVNAVKNDSEKNQRKESVSMQMLKSATKIEYGFSNGAVAPEGSYQGTIIVTPNDVTLDITHGSSLCYTETRNLTTSQYTSFLNRLYGLGIKPNPDEPIMLDGLGIELDPDGILMLYGSEDIADPDELLMLYYGSGIEPNPDEPVMLDGGDVYYIRIQKGKSTLLEGVEDEDIVTAKGNLRDAFVPLLNSSMREVYNNPGSTFVDIFPEDTDY